MLYNIKRKMYPDGTLQLLICDQCKTRGSKSDKPKKTVHSGKEVKRKELDNQKRARQKVYDLARSNTFQWFVTLTLNGDLCDRYDYDSCRRQLETFTKWLTVHNCKYIIVPEQHSDGAYHFHGLVQGDLLLVQAVNAKTLEPIPNIYNISNYNLGFTTVSKIKYHNRVATYLTKYLTKELSVPKGRKRYWASCSLDKPVVSYQHVLSLNDYIPDMECKADFVKHIISEYGNYTLLEYHYKG